MKDKTLKPVTFYVTPDDYVRLKGEADDHGVTLSYYICALISQYSPVKISVPAPRGAPTGNINRQLNRTRFEGL